LLVCVVLGWLEISAGPLSFLVRLVSYYLLSTLTLWESLMQCRGNVEVLPA